MELILIFFILQYYDIASFLISLPIQLFNCLTLIVAIVDSALYIFCSIVFGICIGLILRNVNNKLSLVVKNNKRIDRFVLHEQLRQFMSDHNEICRLFLVCNKFFSKLYFNIVITIVPASLILFQSILFEEISNHVKSYSIFLTIVVTASIFISQYFYAYLTKQVHKHTLLLSKLQWKIKGWPFRLSTKLKLMAYFERLSANKKIGLTLGPTVTLTFSVFAQV